MPYVPMTPPLGGSHTHYSCIPIDSKIREMGYLCLAYKCSNVP